jgi:AraC-like DNA-binding protein
LSIASQDKIYRTITNQLEPWSNAPDLSWMVTTRYRRNLQLCGGVEMVRKKAPGKGIPKNWASRYQKISTLAHSWPEDHLISARHPKLMCILDGVANIHFYDYSLLAPKSTFLFIPPGVPNSDGIPSFIPKDNPDATCEICFMRPMGDELQFWIVHSNSERNIVWQWANVLFLSQRLNLFMRLLNEEILSPPDSEPPLAPHILRLLMSGLRREAKSGRYLVFGQEEQPSWKFQVAVNPIEQAKDYIDAHYGSAITLETLAYAVGMSRTSLALRFKQQTGKTVVAYLTERRLAKACELLGKSEWTITAISKFLGFRSLTYFHQLFRKHEGCTPQEYRDSYRKRQT